jgi:RNA polymerase sigma-70 factor (ECF subfamily)
LQHPHHVSRRPGKSFVSFATLLALDVTYGHLSNFTPADYEHDLMSPDPIAKSSVPYAARTVDADDAALLKRVSDGDKAALAALYREYHRRLARFLGRFTRRDDMIEEVINDTFMIVWQKAGEFRNEARVSTWLMGIAYRVTLKALRQGSLPSAPPSHDHEGLTSEPFVAHELIDWVTKGLTRLSPEQRAVMELAYVMGHSLEEIAEIADCPVSTVKARMFHARVKLRNLMPELAGLAGDGL